MHTCCHSWHLSLCYNGSRYKLYTQRTGLLANNVSLNLLCNAGLHIVTAVYKRTVLSRVGSDSIAFLELRECPYERAMWQKLRKGSVETESYTRPERPVAPMMLLLLIAHLLLVVDNDASKLGSFYISIIKPPTLTLRRVMLCFATSFATEVFILKLLSPNMGADTT